ncbi:TIGR01777 family protein [Robertkochia marina]|uniref:TIGR01777 family protein n=1 Tax=Robertkochia marina TaxID=1227945 RepID=A0A4V3UY39_9FLAO|nr:TIGR01777 family oxidoreductase [Robertkochia marina]THD67356.1 TIGR01777 family protein [Robertkochia marina]TRZ43012.1 TIGR01777 family protein [Robertkochia marina]
MRLLITGATGLVGRAIVKKCLKQGISVNYLTTSKNKLDAIEGCKGFYWNPSKNIIDTSCFQGVDAMINLAGSSIAKRWTTSYRKKVLESRVDSLNTLRSGLQDAAAKPNFLISASAIGVYPSSLTHYYEEDCPEVADTFLGKVVNAWEEAADQFESLGVGVAKIRIGLVLSDEEGALPKMAAPVRNYAGAAFGSGEQWQSWIHIKDLADIFLFVLQHELTGVYNGVAPNPVTQNKLIQVIAQTLNKPLWLPNIPEFVITALLGEMSSILLESQRVSAKKLEAGGFSFKYPNLMPALTNLLI